MVSGYISIRSDIGELVGTITDGNSVVTKNVPGIYKWAKSVADIRKPAVLDCHILTFQVTAYFNVSMTPEPDSLVLFSAIVLGLNPLIITITKDDEVVISFGNTV